MGAPIRLVVGPGESVEFPIRAEDDVGLKVVRLLGSMDGTPLGMMFRVYSGVLKAGDTVMFGNNRNTERIGRILRMHANQFTLEQAAAFIRFERQGCIHQSLTQDCVRTFRES